MVIALKETPRPAPGALSIRDVAQALGVCKKTVRRMIADKEIQALRLKGSGTRDFFRITRQEFDKFLRQKRA